jgi:glutamyl/glutaminyl-tRNA synthetase
MLTLDPYSENVLFQCDRCRFVGELITHIVEEDGSYYCWNCLSEMNQRSQEQKRKKYATS